MAPKGIALYLQSDGPIHVADLAELFDTAFVCVL